MKRKTFFRVIGLIFVLVLGPAAVVSGASRLVLSPAGANAFVLQGTAMDGVAGMNITLTYDAAALTNPRVGQGDLISGALLAVNDRTPGTLRIGVIRTTPLQGGGTIATLSFDAAGSSVGKVFSLSARLTALDGSPITARVQVINPGEPGGAGDSEQSASAAGGQSTPSGSYAPSRPGTGSGAVSTPGADTGAAGGGTVEEYRGGSGVREPGAPPVGEAVQTWRMPGGQTGWSSRKAGKEIYTIKSVPDRFKDYSGERELRAYISLFAPDRASGFRQAPVVVLTEGETPVKVIITIGPGYGSGPDVSALGAWLVSMTEDPDNGRALGLKIIPGKGMRQALLTVPQVRLTYEAENLEVLLPLAMAPKLDIDLDRSGTVTEADFSLFLGKGDVADLNGDGKRDYLDAYLFTANYLAVHPGELTAAPESGKAAAPPSPPRQEQAVMEKKRPFCDDYRADLMVFLFWLAGDFYGPPPAEFSGTPGPPSLDAPAYRSSVNRVLGLAGGNPAETAGPCGPPVPWSAKAMDSSQDRADVGASTDIPTGS